eukprot:gnl/Dysnectes_brevis/930_a1035_5657.p1 GENE.gnl/Dysnectes_brevis/930_a1035_5657~~gnl/Dysnectes_brevis/930_a1035_5657.p1  ORF type:complete len:268 (+),score=67.81 gnl/Dysnectes_brevis/930_a1035_5657:68-805(+)
MSSQQAPREKSGNRGNRGGPRGRRDGKKDEWTPATKLGRLVKSGKIASLSEIFKFSMPVKEAEIIEHFMPGEALTEEVLAIQSIQKQTSAGQRTRFCAHLLVGDGNGHVGYGCGVSKEVAGAIRKGVANAKINLIPIRRGYWGSKIGAPHTIACKLSGKCGSVGIRLIPAPRGSGVVASKVVTKVLAFGGVEDVFTSQYGHTRTLMNSARATYYALRKSYEMLTPDMWPETQLTPDIKSMADPIQ